MRARERPRVGVLGVRRLTREQLGGELARRLALARAGGPVEQIGVRRAVAEGGAEHGGGMRMGLEDAHWA